MFRKLILRAAVIGLAFLSPNAPGHEIRTWSDLSGAHKVEAAFVSAADGIVTLRAADGKMMRVPEERLCADDKALIAALHRQANAGPDAEENAIDLAELQAAIEDQRRAQDVVSMYEAYLAQGGISAEDRAVAETELRRWQALAADNAIHYGGEWRTQDAVDKLREGAQILIDQSFRHIEVGNDALARETLLKASKIDPEGVRADFALGLLHALVGGHPDDARKHFLVCIRRLEEVGEHRTSMQTANFVAAMNNAAIAEVRIKANGSALKRWRTAVESGKVPPELVQNVGRFSDLAAAQEFVTVSVPTMKAIGELYATAAGENASRPYDASIGWLYMPHVSDAKKNENDAKGKNPDNENAPRLPRKLGESELKVCATGSGFAIGADLIVTNRHVAEGAQGFGLHGEGPHLAELSGEVVALCDEADLALLKFPGLRAIPLLMPTELPRLSASIRVLGYPETQLLGNSLKVTAGSVAGLPSRDGDAEIAQMLLLDAIANPGNSGGPVINARGEAVGVLTLGVKVSQQYTAAVPATIVRNFLDAQGVNVKAGDGTLEASAIGGEVEWEEVVARAAPATFQILVLGSPERIAWAGRQGAPDDQERPKPPAKWNGLEDRWCMHCNGLAHVACPNRACRAGAIVYREREIIDIPGGRPIQRWATRQRDCGTCGGDGRVSCPYCAGGFDPRLR